MKLVRVDPQTLATLAGPRADVAWGGCASRMGGESCWSIPPWSFSPGFAQLAVARNGRFTLRSLRLVDVARMSVIADLRLPGGPIGALAWVARGRLLAVQEVCCSERQRLLAIDVRSRRVTARRAPWGSVLRLEPTPQGFVLLLAPARAVGEARLAVAGPAGTLRVVRLARIAAGVAPETGSASGAPLSVPGLAVDPEGRRAFVVAPALVAEIDLRTLAVSDHRLSRPASLLARFHAWLEPAAQAKEATGPTREARWLGGGLLAVSGSDEDRTLSRPAGLVLVDTRSWSARTIDGGASAFAVGGDLLLATGGKTGLTAYGLDGQRRFRLFDGKQAWVDRVYDGRAYVGIAGETAPERLRVVDLGSGRAVGERTLPLPWLLLDSSSGWWSSP